METMQRMINEDFIVDYIITSPPYNTVNNGKALMSESARKIFVGRYDVLQENMTNEEYLEWTRQLFNNFDKILKKNGCILYVLGYGNGNPTLMYDILHTIIHDTVFTVADNIVWKKHSVIPNVSAYNKLTRTCEYIYVICREDEYMTFETNKKVTAIRKDGRKYYNDVRNFIDCYNNDFKGKGNRFYLNGATFSTELVQELIDRYVPDDKRTECIVYDPFMGSGTTGNACKLNHIHYIGSEISKDQTEFALNRINNQQTKLV